MNKINLLPIGTVCKIKEKDVEAMIIGYFEVNKKNKTIYDYKAVIYPYGILNLKIHFYFNTNDIEKVLYRGYDNINFKAFELGVNKALNNEKMEDIFK